MGIYAGTPCMLSHETADITVELTYDPSVPIYSISVTQQRRFTPASPFSMQFSGRMPLIISTDQHRLIDMGRTVSVTDSGFGNVLNGLQFNDSVAVTLGAQSIKIPLVNAADQVAAFRACNVMPAV